MKTEIRANVSGANLGHNMGVLLKEYDQNKEKVIDMLVDACMTVDCEIPRVVKGRFE